MGFVVHQHDARMAGDPVPKSRPGVQCLRLAHGRTHPIKRRTGLSLPRVVEQAMNVGEIQRAACAGPARFVLQNGCQVPVPAPLDRNQGVGIKDVRSPALRPEIHLQPLEDSQVRRNDHKVTCHRGITLAQRMKVAPHNGETHHLRLAGTRCHLERVPAPGVFLFRHTQRRRLGIGPAILGNKLRQGLQLAHLFEVNQRLDSFALAEVIAELVSADGMRPAKPVIEQMT